MTTPDTSSLLDRAKAWFRGEMESVKNFRENVDPHKSLLMDAVAGLQALEERVAALEAVAAKDAPAVAEAVKDVETVAEDASKAASGK